MRVVCYKDLAIGRLSAQLKKVITAIANDDFKSPNVKKLQVGPYYRAKLDDSNRLLLTFMRHAEQTVCLVLEVIANHAYDKSRFLRGATVDWSKLEDTALDALPDQLPSAGSGVKTCQAVSNKIGVVQFPEVAADVDGFVEHALSERSFRQKQQQ